MITKLSMNELKRKSLSEFKKSDKNKAIVVLDNIRSMHNIGSIFRTSDAFLIESIYLCGITAKPPHREIEKSALGATDSVQWHYFDKTTDALIKLKEAEYTIIAIEQAIESTPLNEAVFEENKKTAFVFGNEVEGVSEEALKLCDSCIEIPQFGTKHSFNVSVSAGIVLWDFFRQSSFN